MRKIGLFFLLVILFTFSFFNSAHAKKIPQAPVSSAKTPDTFFGPHFITGIKSVALFDSNGRMLAGKNADVPRPIASLTKLMTAMVALDLGFNFEGAVTYDPQLHYVYKNYLHLKKGDVIKNKDLWYAMLVGSINEPARMIVDSIGIPEDIFVLLMNEKARAMGLSDAVFVDPHGLSPHNIASATSIAKLLQNALHYSVIAETLATDYYAFDELLSADTRDHHQFEHTNTLLKRKIAFSILASKTGYLWEAGPCIAMKIMGETNKEFIVVTLGEPDYYRRFKEIPRLFSWWKKQNAPLELALQSP